MSSRCLPAYWTRLTALAALLVFSPDAAEALTIRLCECSMSDPDFNPGSILSLGFRIEGAPGEAIYGLGVSVYGYNESVVDFVSGSTVPSIFHAVAIPAIGAFNGLGNTLTNPLGETSIGASGNRVLIFNGVGLSSVRYNPLDPGLDGVIGGGDAQIRVTFMATGPGVSSLLIGTGYIGDGVVVAGGQVIQSNTIQLTLVPGYAPSCPIPEPNTGLLLGLGLTGLAGRKQRSTHRI